MFFPQSPRIFEGDDMNHFRQILFYVEYLSFRFLAFVNNCLPINVTEWITEKLGYGLFPLLGKRKRTALENLKLAFNGSKTEAELYEIARQSFINLLRVGSECVRIPHIVKTPDRYVKGKNIAFFKELLKRNRGVIVLVSHFANWELMALATMSEGYPLHAVARPVKNPFVYRHIKFLRNCLEVDPINKQGAVRETIRRLEQNKIVVILIDQHERQGGVWVDFFGRKASTSGLPAMLALKHNVPVVPAFFFRQLAWPATVEIGQEFSIIKTGDLKADILANTQQYIRRIEEVVSQRPGEWLWMHRRWRTH